MNIKILVMDVDGTLTDGRIYIGAQGEVMKAFDVRDGYAIAISFQCWELPLSLSPGGRLPLWSSEQRS